MSGGTKIMKPVPVESYSVKVLGGTFHVKEVLVEDGGSPEEVTAIIKGTSEDLWFVMAAEDTAEQTDSLALIDDDLDFKVCALGELSPD